MNDLVSYEPMPGTVAYAGYGTQLERQEWNRVSPRAQELSDDAAWPVLQGLRSLEVPGRFMLVQLSEPLWQHQGAVIRGIGIGGLGLGGSEARHMSERAFLFFIWRRLSRPAVRP
jgi:hypothetical protein